ncbi:MAG TPA: hypothetical protein VGW34_00015 [Allosphingosinicella sp.]|nr:hypothetical protein [Allosphingosinicella sp.]
MTIVLRLLRASLGRAGLGLLAVIGADAHGAPQPPEQTESDGYTRYELLAPGSGKFRILYDVTATAPGAIFYFNPIRPGSIATDERVIDRATGKPLHWDIVDAAAAAAGGVRGAEPGMKFIRVKLARPVPPGGGEARLLIDKTYQDAKSYFAEGEAIVFDRSLGVKRNSVLLPLGYELVSSNYPAQILQEPDGRMLVSFWNVTPAPAPVRIEARPAPAPRLRSVRREEEQERAKQSREITYYLNAPETHSFRLAHDYTETRPGTATYLNIVRPGSTVSEPSARNLDTGETLQWEIIRGAKLLELEPGATGIGPGSEAVLFRFPPVRPGESVRLRITETYTDDAGYKLLPDGSLLWERSLSRPDNAVVLPHGWMLAGSTMPCTVGRTDDGRIRLQFLNPRPDELAVRIVARRRNRSR